ncbi:MAG: glycerol kinase GlpK [Spirochaetales bacterium]|nr:glycerol kinase GlpK [Spirochaetales bacterium]
MGSYILALDQGTTSSRAIVFDTGAAVVSIAQIPFKQIYPKPGWVEHDPMEILSTQIDAARGALEKAKIDPSCVAAIGITNQRETTIVWDKRSGRPVYNAIVWQCRRTTDICRTFIESGQEPVVREKTGLLIDPYFSGTKLLWLLGNIDGLQKKAEKGELLFGTVDSWLVFNLTGKHLTDPSNASRTLLFNIKEGNWDKELCREWNIPGQMLPEVMRSSGVFGMTKKEIFGKEIPISGIAGDQQAALFGQGCFRPGNAKNTYGTGCFCLMPTGRTPVESKNKLLTTVAWDRGEGLEYALEGSIFIAGAVVQWLRDNMGFFGNAAETEALASGIPDTGGVYFVPAFVGMGTPYWDPDVRGTIVGLTRGTERAHIVRAALESIAFQSKELFDAMERDTGTSLSVLRVDGGAAKNDFLMQFQADITGIPVERPKITETTALGAAFLAGLAVGYWRTVGEIASTWQCEKRFSPLMDDSERSFQMKSWKKAVEAARCFVP